MVLASEWIKIFKNLKKALILLRNDYGNEYSYLKSKRDIILALLNLHKLKFGNKDVIIVRVPGRINLMGRHIDHQGGHVNLIAIDKEIFITASKRNDSKIRAFNILPNHFHSVSINFELIDINFPDSWENFIDNYELIRSLRSPDGHWENYIKSSFYKIWFLNGKLPNGANLCVSGTIPIAAGVSSSSALTVGMFMVLAHLNNINFKSLEMAKYSGEAEWFSGTRGGISDQAAMVLGKKNKIMHAKFFNLEIIDYIPFPKSLTILLCNTKIKADKSGDKKDLFNQKVMAYQIGFLLFKRRFPQFRDKLNRLRDINPSNLGINSANIIDMLRDIPEYLKFKQIKELLGDLWENLIVKFPFNETPESIPIRKVIAYGISECERSKIFIDLIRDENFEELGKLMHISHDGDRVIDYSNPSIPRFFNNELTKLKLDALIGQKRRLAEISGGYGCSIAEIDFLVDASKILPGVVGAQISGAGLGGSCIIFIQKGLSSQIKHQLEKKYFKMFKKHCETFLVQPVNGSSVYIDT